jgi:hypothetical protein
MQLPKYFSLICRFLLTDRRQASPFPTEDSLSSSPSPSSPVSSSYSSSSSSNYTWKRRRATTICSDQGAADPVSGAGASGAGAAANWRRRHHSTGTRQPTCSGHFSDFTLYPDRFLFFLTFSCMSSILDDQWRRSYMSPNAGPGGGGGVRA